MVSICSGATDQKEIALTFDDGPDPQLTPQVLEVLAEFDAKGTFFCIGSKVAASPELLQHMDSEGHLLGNHTFSHSHFFDFFPAAKVKAELARTNDQIQQTLGKSSFHCARQKWILAQIRVD